MERYHPMTMGKEVHVWTVQNSSKFLDTNPLNIQRARRILKSEGHPFYKFQPMQHLLGFEKFPQTREVGVHYLEKSIGGLTNGGVASLQIDDQLSKRVHNYLDNYLHGRDWNGQPKGYEAPFYLLVDKATEVLVYKELFKFQGFVALLNR